MTGGGTTQSTTAFNPKDCTKSNPIINSLPGELWMTVLESHCTFPRDVFSTVMLNLAKNPNITSSHLFRADILYDTGNDRTLDHIGQSNGTSEKNPNEHYQPVKYERPGFDLTRTIVRRLVPRNPQLDRSLVQTCHFFSRSNETEEWTVIIYIPHVQQAEDMPFYHPSVSRLALIHKWQRTTLSGSDTTSGNGCISISYCFFPETDLTTKLERTALCLLQTIHKHGQGQLAGYEKRVHHDQIVPQKRYQDTYTLLKTKYGRQLSENWVEVTDPGKHVFEDIGIAAFLIEVWRDMYQSPEVKYANGNGQVCSKDIGAKPLFPGFVDIGCGNGILVYILVSEGYEGWGFDARERKTWSTFPVHVQQRLQQRLLVPGILSANDSVHASDIHHNGIFEPSTFIISNHADELTTWTPLLAYLNNSAFIAIPCCSHDLAGARFRAPLSTKAAKEESVVRLPQQVIQNGVEVANGAQKVGMTQAAETGTLRKSVAQKKMASAYSTLCSYVASLADEVALQPEKEVLRIPSTRNQCIISRSTSLQLGNMVPEDPGVREEKVIEIVERELGRSIEAIGSDWITRAMKLAEKPGSGH